MTDIDIERTPARVLTLAAYVLVLAFIVKAVQVRDAKGRLG